MGEDRGCGAGECGDGVGAEGVDPHSVGHVDDYSALSSYAKELARLERMNLLILDDWGLQPLDHHAKMAIMQLVEDRHGKTATVITSQLPINKWYDYLDEPTLADAILDRILQHANRIELKGQSMRVRKNMQQNQV